VAYEFDSFWSDGTRHDEVEAAQPIAEFRLSWFRAIPLGADAGFMTYFCPITLPDGSLEHPMAAGSSG